jgi:multidrug transporter EmrE-like cation transporter
LVVIKWLVLLTAILSNASANILIKFASKKISEQHSSSLITSFLFNKYLLIGIILFGLSLLFYTYALTKIPLNIAYTSMTSIGVVLINVLSIYLFNEKLSFPNFAGISLIVIGLFLVTGVLSIKI